MKPAPPVTKICFVIACKKPVTPFSLRASSTSGNGTKRAVVTVQTTAGQFGCLITAAMLDRTRPRDIVLVDTPILEWRVHTVWVRRSIDAKHGIQLFQRASAALSRREIPQALKLLRLAERLGHDPVACSAQRWSCWMLTGRFEEAWRESDRIAAHGRSDPHRFWDGRPFTGKRVLIRCLHGFGDAIQFIRYVSPLSKDAACVIVQTHPELVNLMRCVPSVDHVISWEGEREVEWDQQIELMELPRALRTTLETTPNEVPYLIVNNERSAPTRVPPKSGGRPRVGLQWGSGCWNSARSMRLADLTPILQSAAFDFYSFQRGAPSLEVIDSPFRDQIRDVSGEAPDILEAAADLLNVDLLITVDTMLAHLAGALGIPVWVLLPWAADWRWMIRRRDSPWYPTMRLFRQESPDDWSTPVHEAAAELTRNPPARW